MTQQFSLHPDNPQQRLINLAVDRLKAGALLVYPTESTYALGCAPLAKEAQEQIRRIRQLDVHHDLSLLFKDMSQLSGYTRLDNNAFRLIKKATPGPFTFILEATKEVPKKLADPKRKTIGARIPDHPVPLALIEGLGEPLLNATLSLPDDDMPMMDPEDIVGRLQGQVDLVLDAGWGGAEPSTVIDLTEWPPQVVRVGAGDPEALGLSGEV